MSTSTGHAQSILDALKPAEPSTVETRNITAICGSKTPLYAFKRLREKRGLTQVEVGKSLNISHKTVSRYESGHLFATMGNQLEKLRAFHQTWIEEENANPR